MMNGGSTFLGQQESARSIGRCLHQTYDDGADAADAEMLALLRRLDAVTPSEPKRNAFAHE